MKSFERFGCLLGMAWVLSTRGGVSAEPKASSKPAKHSTNRLLEITGLMQNGYEYKLRLQNLLVVDLGQTEMLELSGLVITPKGGVAAIRLLLSPSDVATIAERYRVPGQPDLRVVLGAADGEASIAKAQDAGVRRRELRVQPADAAGEAGVLRVERIGAFSDFERLMHEAGSSGQFDVDLAVAFYSIVTGAGDAERGEEGPPTFSECLTKATAACEKSCGSLGIQDCIGSFTWTATSCAWTCLSHDDCRGN